MMNQSEELSLMSRFVPEGTQLYCYGLWKEHKFTFKIHRPRKTKLGDFRFRDNQYIITVNNDLNKFSFLLTYIHEVAHLVTYEKFKSRVLPHGREWKEEFKKLLEPILAAKVLPPDVSKALSDYIRNPKASSCSDHKLLLVLARYDKGGADKTRLGELSIGTHFVFQGKEYRKDQKRRTRSICLELSTGRKYLIAEVAEVEVK